MPGLDGQKMSKSYDNYIGLFEDPKNLKKKVMRIVTDSKTVEENVMFPLDVLTKMAPDEKLDRVNFCLKRVGLENVNKKMPSEISGGMKKRVGIARAIVNNSQYLFCDEPNSGLDPQTAILIDNLIREITVEFDITTIVVTHDMNSVMEIGDYIMFLIEPVTGRYVIMVRSQKWNDALRVQFVKLAGSSVG